MVEGDVMVPVVDAVDGAEVDAISVDAAAEFGVDGVVEDGVAVDVETELEVDGAEVELDGHRCIHWNSVSTSVQFPMSTLK